jgi:hypothetical protein
VFTVTLSAQTSQTVTVDFDTSNGTATAPGDYSTTTGQLVFSPGDTSELISVPVIGDDLDESDETFNVTISATNADTNDAVGVGTIRDDDGVSGVASFLISDIVVVEGNSGTSNAVFTVVLSEAATEAVTVDFITSDGSASASSDYVTRSGTLTFASGVTSRTISVPIVGDTIVESDETFFVNLTNPNGAEIGDSQATGTISNDDSITDPGETPALAVNDVSTAEGNSGTTNMIFNITLSASSTATVTVDVTTIDGSAQSPSDFDSRGGRLTFLPGETNKTLVVPIRGDLTDEPNETFFVHLSNATNATISDSQGVGTILDDDPATVPPLSLTISDVSIVEGDSGTTNALFQVFLSTSTTQTVTLNFSTVDGSATAGVDYLAQSGQVTLAPGDTVELISVPILGDNDPEIDETFFVNLSAAVNASIGDAQGMGVIEDDDSAGGTPQLSIGDVSIVEGDAGTSNAVFTVTMSATSTQTVTVDFTTANGTASAPSDYDTTSGTLSFAPGEQSQTIIVPVRGDTLAEPNEQFFVNLTNASNATISDGQAVGNVLNDEGPTPPGACTAINVRGSLRIVADDSSNVIDISDNGSGTITVSSDCGISGSFESVSRIQVFAEGGNDSVDYRITGNPSVPRWVAIDLGDGDDSASVEAVGVSLARNLQVRVNGGSGTDAIAAAIDAVIEQAKTPLGLILNGGPGADSVHANVRLAGEAAKGTIRVAGDRDDDDLSLNLLGSNDVLRRLRARVDGGRGLDSCSVPGAGQSRKC